jgi:glycosyltransferase involved in cell wall biosynthesis
MNKDNIKIAHVIFSFTTGGAESMLVDVMNEQIINHEVTLIVINNSFDINLLSRIDSRVNIYLLKRRIGSFSIFPLFRFNYLIGINLFDVIHFHNENAINLLFRKFDIIRCLTIHGMNKPVNNLKKYDRVFVISKSVAADVFTRSKIEPIVIYNGILFDRVDFNLNVVNSDRFRIIQVGRLQHEVKGQDILVKAVKLINDNCELPNVEVDFIGEGVSVDYLQKLTKELNLDGAIRFLGKRDRDYIYQNLKNYNLLVQPSFDEGFGLTVIEGMAAGIPVLVSNSGGPMEIIDGGEFGFYFENGDVEDLAHKIVHIISEYHSEALFNLMIKARRYAETNFNIVNTSIEYLRNYQPQNLE